MELQHITLAVVVVVLLEMTVELILGLKRLVVVVKEDWVAVVVERNLIL
jgi:hypothetical protein